MFWNAVDPLVGNYTIRQDPHLTSDYHPRIGSPAVGRSMTIPGLAVDLEGVLRPRGGGYDIRAHQGAKGWKVLLSMS